MALACSTQAEHKAQLAGRQSGLVRMCDDRRVEQRRSLEAILVNEAGADQQAALLGDLDAVLGRVMKLVVAIDEQGAEVAMPSAERQQGGGELGRYGIGLHRENASDDPHRPAGIWTVQVAGLGRRKEWPGEHARWVGSEHQRQSPQA